MLKSPMKQVCNILSNDTEVPELMDLVNPEDKASKSDLEAPSAMDSSEICPIITQKQTQKYRVDQQRHPLISGPLPRPIYT